MNIGSPAALVEEVGKGTLRWSEAGEFAGLAARPPNGWPQRSIWPHSYCRGFGRQIRRGCMAGSGALLAGAGLVTIATPDAVLPIVSAAHPELMTEPLVGRKDGTISRENLANRLSNIAKGKTIFAIGPGLGQEGKRGNLFMRSFNKRICPSCSMPMGSMPSPGKPMNCESVKLNFWRSLRTPAKWRAC